MRYAWSEQFIRDVQTLSPKDRKLLKDSRDNFKKAIEQQDKEMQKKFKLHKLHRYNNPDVWAGHLRKNLVFTYHFEDDIGGTILRFRNIGTHSIY